MIPHIACDFHTESHHQFLSPTFSTFPAAPAFLLWRYVCVWCFGKLFEAEGGVISVFLLWQGSKSAQALFKKSFQGMWTPRVSDMP